MFTPELTLNLIRERRYGAKAMERRIKECCAGNPGCPYQAECQRLYDKFVDTTETRQEIYARLCELGVSPIKARGNLSLTKIRQLTAAQC
jgi:hypothetical protein